MSGFTTVRGFVSSPVPEWGNGDQDPTADGLLLYDERSPILTESEKLNRPPRRRELDLLRGVALIVMVVGHPIRAALDRPGMDPARFFMNYYGELFSAFFMFMSAINVTNFIASAKRDPLLDPTRFYVRSSIALFLLGTSYNLCVGTLPVIDIIQAVALGTLFVYLLLSWRVPTWGFGLITLAFWGFGLYCVSPSPVTNETLANLEPFGYLFKLFGPIPWFGFFTYGIFVDRIPRNRTEVALLPLFAALFIAGHFLPVQSGTMPAVALLKANLRYFLLTAGLFPLLLIVTRRWYRGGQEVAAAARALGASGPFWTEKAPAFVARFGKMFEFWGVESLIFLVFHWAIIDLLKPYMVVTVAKGHETIGVWSVGLATLFVMSRLVGPIAAKRDAWLKQPGFPKRAWRFFIASGAGWALTSLLLLATAASAQKHLAGVDISKGLANLNPALIRQGAAALLFLFMRKVFSYGMGFSFCFLYPHVRTRIRDGARRASAPVSGRLVKDE